MGRGKSSAIHSSELELLELLGGLTLISHLLPLVLRTSPNKQNTSLTPPPPPPPKRKETPNLLPSRMLGNHVAKVFFLYASLLLPQLLLIPGDKRSRSFVLQIIFLGGVGVVCHHPHCCITSHISCYSSGT